MATSNAAPSSAAHASTSTHFRLLDLPVELQLQIYEEVVVQNTPIWINFPCSFYFGDHSADIDKVTMAWEAGKTKWDAGEKEQCMQPALTKVCKSIRNAALKAFYGKNEFEVYFCDKKYVKRFMRWLEMIGVNNHAKLRCLYLFDPNVKDSADDFLDGLMRERVFLDLGGWLEIERKSPARNFVKFPSGEPRKPL